MSVTLERKLARRSIAKRVDEILPLEFSKQTPSLEVRPGPIGKPGGTGLWHVKGMGFPPYFQNVRNALIRNGHSVATASKITWGAIRKWARGGGNVHPEVRSAARRALASIAGKEARAHAQHAVHDHTTLRDQLMLREFSCVARYVELADPYHSSTGKFTSAGNQGSAQPKTNPTKATKQQSVPPTISPQKKQQLLKQAAADQALAAKLRAEAAKLNQQIAALAALIAVQQKALATSSQGTTTSGTGTQTKTATGTTTTATATGTATSSTKSSLPSGAQTGYNTQTNQAALSKNQALMKSLVNQRNALLQHASQLDRQAQNDIQQANG